MSEYTKHSPGPWVHESRDGDVPRNKSHEGWGVEGLWDANGNLILGSDFGWDAMYLPPSNPFDRKLLEAAPDMAEVLLAVYAGETTLGTRMDRRIQQVLAKAGVLT